MPDGAVVRVALGVEPGRAVILIAPLKDHRTLMKPHVRTVVKSK